MFTEATGPTAVSTYLTAISVTSLIAGFISGTLSDRLPPGTSLKAALGIRVGLSLTLIGVVALQAAGALNSQAAFGLATTLVVGTSLCESL